jgi:UDP-N-acetylmuramate: L-alanyl-gamma-D-glutamyl-meso-diaminopimelate ligase
VHFIATGGAVMHNLAIALHKKGYVVTGSDDEIYEPAASRLASYGLMPDETGWFPQKITADINTIVLGMHAKADNPELIKARELGIRIFSFPEYLYEQTRNKKRIVVGGSHGKTTTTAMIMHVMAFHGIKFDYMIGSAIEGYETMVGLSDDADIAIFEGDEYLSSPLDRRPKFHLYAPDIAIINGIAWDHMNVFPTYEGYVEQFKIFTDKITPGGTLAYFTGDSEVVAVAEAARPDIIRRPYDIHGYMSNRTGVYALTHNRTVKVDFFGRHNMQNMSAAREACLAAGITDDQFYQAIPSFTGTSKRLQKLRDDGNTVVFHDFAHAPSKVKATVDAVAETYQGWNIAAILELHTYSSLNSAFISHYSGTLNSATHPFVYYNPHAISLKKLPMLNRDEVAAAFDCDRLTVTDNSAELFSLLPAAGTGKTVWLFMSSGDFDGNDLKKIAETL